MILIIIRWRSLHDPDNYKMKIISWSQEDIIIRWRSLHDPDNYKMEIIAWSWEDIIIRWKSWHNAVYSFYPIIYVFSSIFNMVGLKIKLNKEPPTQLFILSVTHFVFVVLTQFVFVVLTQLFYPLSYYSFWFNFSKNLPFFSLSWS